MTKVSRKEILPYVDRIKSIAEEFESILVEMPNCSAKKAFLNSSSNLNAKVTKYSSAGERFFLSEEEKELIRNHREGKIAPTETETNEVPTNFETDISMKKKKSKKEN